MFGKECRWDFILQKDWTFINHGSYGRVPKCVVEKQESLQRVLESSPDNWFRRLYAPLWNENVDAAANFLKSDPNNLVLVPNATTGVNCILKSINFEREDSILINSWTYGAVKNAARATMEMPGYYKYGSVRTLTIPDEIKDVQQILNAFETELANNPNIKLAIIDLIVSGKALMMPVTDIAALCKKHKVLVLVDGAHGPGQVDIDLEEMGRAGVDFFTGNFHKWAFCPRGCAALWVHPKHHSYVKPLITSHSYCTDRWRDEFLKQGTLDNTSYCVVKDAIAFMQSKGGMEAIIAYNNDLVQRAARFLIGKWKTSLHAVPDHMRAPCMRLIALPDHLQATHSDADVMSELHELVKLLEEKFMVDIQPSIVGKSKMIRISAQIYNSEEDYEELVQCLEKVYESK